VKELGYAKMVCEDWAVPHHVVDLRSLRPLLGGSTLTDFGIPEPEGHSTDPAMSATVVPNRNMIMLSIAVGYAVSHDVREVWFGAHAGDRIVYPDCRPLFIEQLNEVTLIANTHPVRIVAPFIDLDKVGILRIGHDLHLDYTRAWACYAGEDIACGRCGSCQERLEAFDRLAWTDPMAYATRELVPHE